MSPGEGEVALPPGLPQGCTVAVVDPWMDGHHTTYLRLVSKMLLDLGARVMLLCPEPREVTDWLETHTAHRDLSRRVVATRFQLSRGEHAGPGSPPKHRLAGLAEYLNRWRSVARAIRDLRRHAGDGSGPAPRWVLFLWLDDFLSSARYLARASPFFLPFLFRYPWAGLFFRPVHLRDDAFPPSRHPYSALRQPSCRRVFIHDESKLTALDRRVAPKARLFPDFTDETPPDDSFALLKELRLRARGRRIVCALGSMSKRKGILTLLEVAESSGDPPWFFLFAGELVEHHFSAPELARLHQLSKNPPENCCFYFQRIADESSFNALVAASDIVFAAYRNFRHSSNILTKAALFKKPVIVSRGHLMAARTRRFRLGAVIEQDSAVDCARALRRLSDPSRQEPDKPRFDDYMQRHSLASFRAELTQLLKEQA